MFQRHVYRYRQDSIAKNIRLNDHSAAVAESTLGRRPEIAFSLQAYSPFRFSKQIEPEPKPKAYTNDDARRVCEHGHAEPVGEPHLAADLALL